MGSWLFGKSNSSDAAPAAAMRIQSSAQGQTRPLLCGQTRISGNLIWFGGLIPQAIQQSSAGGKGIFGGSGGGSVSYNYTAYVAIGLCAGPIDAILTIYDSSGGANAPSAYNMTVFLGDYSQLPWGYLTANFPDQALNYRGLAFGAFEPMPMGSSPSLPNITYEARGAIKNAVPGLPDADPRDWIKYLLTDAHEGVGFEPARLGVMAQLSSYARATGLLISQALVEQQSAQKVLQDLAQAINFDFRWSGGLLDAVPYGDQAISLGQLTQASETHGVPVAPYAITVDHAATFVSDGGVKYQSSGIPLVLVAANPAAGQYAVNLTTGIYQFAAADTTVGVTIVYTWAAQASYVPNNTPVYDVVDDDYLPNQGSIGAGNSAGSEPLTVVVSDQSLVINDVKVEYLDRANAYNPVAIDAKDEAGIQVFGKKASDLRSFHIFALASAASLSASLQLVREQITRQFSFTLGPWAILADVLDILTASRTPMGMVRQGVTIAEIQENTDGTLTFTCDEYLGTTSAPAYGRQATSGYSRNINADPGQINPPIIFEPTAELLGGASLEIWGAISGQDTTDWGGYNVYASFDGGVNFALVGDPMRGPARMGVLTAPLPQVAENPTGTTIDVTSTLAVDISESASQLLPASQADVLALATACYVGGEIVAYRDAALTAVGKYNLSYLVRGAFGTETEIVTHPTGSGFARLDQGIFKVPFDQSMIGSTVYLKFQSFNQFGGGLQTLDELAAYPYVIQGSALKSPLPVVQNVRTQFTDGFTYIYWDDVTDFRTGIRYKIFKGSTFAGAQQVGDNAHAPFIAFGTDTYWIVAYCQPVPGLYVYSETPTSITIAGNMLVKNLVFQSDQQAAGWPGIFSNGVGRDGPNIRLGGAGNILGVSDFLNLSDVLNYGGTISSGTYEVRPQDYVDVGYVADCSVNASWQAAGVPVGQNILAVADFLAMPDVLGSASTQYVNVKVQIATSQSADEGDLYGAGNLYDVTPDLYGYGIPWSDWQDFVPGVYRARLVKFRLLLTTVDGNTICVALAFAYQVSVPPRIDHYPNLSVGTGGLTITFEPDDASIPAPFNGGPPVGGTVHNQPLPFVNFSWAGTPSAVPVVDSLTLAALAFHFEDGSGNHIAVPGVNVQVEGY